MPGAADEPEKISRGQRKSEGFMTQILYRLFSSVQEPPHFPLSPPRLLLLSAGNLFKSVHFFTEHFPIYKYSAKHYLLHALSDCTAATNNYFHY